MTNRVRSKKETAARSQRAGGDSNPSGRSWIEKLLPGMSVQGSARTGVYRIGTAVIGDNRTTRQMFKRKVQRWLGKLAAMNPDERNALLDAIRKHYG